MEFTGRLQSPFALGSGMHLTVAMTVGGTRGAVRRLLLQTKPQAAGVLSGQPLG